MRQFSLVFILMLLISIGQTTTHAQSECEGFTPAPLVIGQNGQVGEGAANNMRDNPTTGGTKVGEIPGGGTFSVLDGPTCADGYVWWQVDTMGWSVGRWTA